MILILTFKCIVNHLSRKKKKTQRINSIIDYDKAHPLFLIIDFLTYISTYLGFFFYCYSTSTSTTYATKILKGSIIKLYIYI
jgi:hypothetical protein